MQTTMSGILFLSPVHKQDSLEVRDCHKNLIFHFLGAFFIFTVFNFRYRVPEISVSQVFPRQPLLVSIAVT